MKTKSSKWLVLAAVILLIVVEPAGRAAEVRYSVTHLQEMYGDDLFFTDLSPGGEVLSGLLSSGGPGYFVVRGDDVSRHVLPDGIGAPINFSDAGMSYGVTFDESGITGVTSISDRGTYRDTGYAMQGTGLNLGRQNNQGAVVGRETGAPGLAGFLYTPEEGGQIVEEMGGVEVTRFSAINDLGWITGSGLDGGHAGMYLWIPGEPVITIGSGSGSPRDLNEMGGVIGRQGSAAFLWEDGNFTYISDIPVPDPNNPNIVRNATAFADVHDIDGSSNVVGFLTPRAVPGFVPSRAGNFGWLWTEEDGLMFLDDLIDPLSPYDLTSGISIAEDGRILASGRIPGSDEIQHFLLTPIPEPSVVSACLLATAPLFRRRR